MMMFIILWTLLATAVFVQVDAAESPLKFPSSKEYKILHLTDLHYCQNPSLDQQTSKLQNDLIKYVQPNIVVVTGDIISAKAYQGQPNYFRDCWRKFVQPFIDNNVHYALALGSDDLNAGAELKDIINFEKSNKLSLYGTASQNSQDFAYYLPIESSGDSKNIAANLWLFNSHAKGDCGQDRNSWGCVDADQIKWYEEKSKLLKKAHGTDVHHMAFLHTPLPEFKKLYNDLEFYGARNQRIGCPLMNTGLFSAFENNKDVTGVFVGHDHYNDFGGLINGIELTYGRVTGYGGDDGMQNYARGARVISLKEKGEKRIERTHYMITENLKDPRHRFELNTEKIYLLRTGFKQDVCRVADTEESIVVSLILMMTAGLIITVVSIGFNQLINKKWIVDFQKKERRAEASKLTKIERIPSTSEFMV